MEKIKIKNRVAIENTTKIIDEVFCMKTIARTPLDLW